MKKEVYVKIKGLQMCVSPADETCEETEALEVINVGTYGVIRDNEYVKYDEVMEGYSEKCSNLIKIGKDLVEVTKKGPVVSHLSFVKGEKTMTAYDTGFGTLYFGIFTKNMEISRKEDEIKVSIDYSIEMNYEKVSDSHVEIEISSTGKFVL